MGDDAEITDVVELHSGFGNEKGQPCNIAAGCWLLASGFSPARSQKQKAEVVRFDEREFGAARPSNESHCSGMSDFKKLRVWHESCRFADRVQTMSRGLRQPERRWAFEQLVPAAHSIHENLAEGWGFDTDPQRLKYCRQALSTTNESEDELLALERKNLLSGFETLPAEARSLGGMLGSLEKRLEDSITKARNARRIIRRKPAADRDAASGKKPAPEAETDPPSD